MRRLDHFVTLFAEEVANTLASADSAVEGISRPPSTPSMDLDRPR